MLDKMKRNCCTAILLLALALVTSSAFGAPNVAQPHGSAGSAHMRGAETRIRHKPGVFVRRGRSPSRATATTVLVGDSAVEWQYDSLAAGEAEAFRLAAKMSGLAVAAHVYISAKSSAKTLIVGLYSSAGSRPGRLLSAGSTSASRPDSWTAVSLAPAKLVSGRVYWLAILGRRGRLRYRDRASGPCPSETSARRDLHALQRYWTTGVSYRDCPASAYVTAAPLARQLNASPLTAQLTEDSLLLAGQSSSPSPAVHSSAAPAATSPPAIYGTAAEGQLLTSSTGTWSGKPTSFSYEWEQCNTVGEPCLPLAGATSASYQAVPENVGHTLRVTVTASNANGSAQATSAPTAPVVRPIFVAQAAAGSESGEGSCANAHPLSWLNTAGNWGAGSGKVNPEHAAELCGTVTEAITVSGSGESGKPITLAFTPGAKIQVTGCPASSGCINTAGHHYITIRGASEAEHGTIEATDQGSKKEYLRGETGINAEGCEGCTIEDMTIANLYDHTEESDNQLEGGAVEVRGITFDGSDLTIAHNTLHDIGWALFNVIGGTDKDVNIEYNTIYRIDHGWAAIANFTGGDVGPISFDHNHVHDFANWDNSAGSYHHDGIHCYSGGGEPQFNGLYIYDNRFDGETGNHMTAQIFIEGSTDGTPCASPTSNLWVFNNIGTVSTPELANGIFGIFSGEPHIFNNTLIGEPAAQQACFSTNNAAAKEQFKNNLLSGCWHSLVAEAPRFIGGGIDYNLYSNGSATPLVCEPKHEEYKYYDPAQFSEWESCVGGDSHSRYDSSAKITSEGALEDGSPARDAGTNLTSLCESGKPTEALCENINGEARPSTGAWNIGAY